VKSLLASILTMALVAAGCLGRDPVPPPRPTECFRDPSCGATLVIAHRGYRGFGAPESTLAAVRDAARVLAHGIEIDPRPTADGALVVLHDPEVDRTTDGHGAVSSLTLADIRSLHVRGADASDLLAVTVPTFEEMLALAKALDLLVVVDANKTDRVDLIVGAVARVGMQASTVLSISSAEKLRLARRLESAIALMPRVATLAELDEVAGALGPVESVELEEPVSVEFVRGAHRRGVKVLASALGVPDALAFLGQADAYAAFVAARPDLVETDLPDRLLQALGAGPSAARALPQRALAPTGESRFASQRIAPPEVTRNGPGRGAGTRAPRAPPGQRPPAESRGCGGEPGCWFPRPSLNAKCSRPTTSARWLSLRSACSGFRNTTRSQPNRSNGSGT
jgi:glycerophosphoryl diester phosphodiesterase